MSSLGISIELLNFRSSTTPWCNGNTAGFGPAIQGSSPCGVALKPLERFVSGAFCVSVPHYVPRFQNTPKQTRISNTTKARLLSLKPLRSSAAMSRSPLENVAVLLRVFLGNRCAEVCRGLDRQAGRKKPFMSRGHKGLLPEGIHNSCSALASWINCSPVRQHTGQLWTHGMSYPTRRVPTPLSESTHAWTSNLLPF